MKAFRAFLILSAAIFALLMWAHDANAQGYSYPTLQGNNAFTGSNTFGSTTHAAITSANVNSIYYVPATSSDWGASINTILAGCPVDQNGYQQCEIHLPQSYNATWSTSVTVTSPGVSIIGQGPWGSAANCTVNGDCLRIYTSPFTIQQGGKFEGFSLFGSGTLNGCGIHLGEIIGATFKSLGVYNFTGANGCDMWLDNAHSNGIVGTWTERNTFEHVEVGNSPDLWRFSVEAGNPSFGYNRFLDIGLAFSPAGGDTGFHLEGTAQLYNTTIRATANAQSALVGTSNFMTLAGTSEYQGELHLTGEGLLTNLFNTVSGTALFLNSDSAISWGTSALPASTIGGASIWSFGPTQGTATWTLSAPPSFPIPLSFSEPIVFGGTSYGQVRITPADDLNLGYPMISGTNNANTMIKWSITKAGLGTFNAGVANSNGLLLPSTLTGYTGTGTGFVVTTGTPATPAAVGVETVSSVAGLTGNTYTLGATAQVGSGASVACATSHVCDSLSGEISLSLGSGSLSNGTLLTVTFPNARNNLPNCAVWFSGNVSSQSKSGSTTQLAFIGTGTASQVATLDYVCGGN